MNLKDAPHNTRCPDIPENGRLWSKMKISNVTKVLAVPLPSSSIGDLVTASLTTEVKWSVTFSFLAIAQTDKRGLDIKNIKTIKDKDKDKNTKTIRFKWHQGVLSTCNSNFDAFSIFKYQALLIQLEQRLQFRADFSGSQYSVLFAHNQSWHWYYLGYPYLDSKVACKIIF